MATKTPEQSTQNTTSTTDEIPQGDGVSMFDEGPEALGEFSAPTSDEEMNSILDELEGDLEGDEEEDEYEDIEDDDPDEDATEEGVQTGNESTDTAPKKDVSKTPKGIDAGDWDRATKALRRDGFEDDDIAGMKPARALELGIKRAKAQSDTDAAFGELQQLKGDDGHTEKEEKADTADPPDLTNALEAIAREHGDETAKSVGEAIKAMSTPILKENAVLHATLVQTRKQVEDLYIASVRSDLVNDYPKLSDSDVFRKVKARMLTLAETESFKKQLQDDRDFVARHELNGQREYVKALMQEAFRWEFSQENQDEKAGKKRTKKRSKRNGQMTPPGSRRSVPEKMSAEEKEDRLLELLEAGAPSHELDRFSTNFQ